MDWIQGVLEAHPIPLIHTGWFFEAFANLSDDMTNTRQASAGRLVSKAVSGKASVSEESTSAGVDLPP
jgi:hypothetical protein